MIDVVNILAVHVGVAGLEPLLDDLAASDTAQSNKMFAEIIRRVRRAANIPERSVTPPGPLLELMGDADDDDADHH